MKQINLHKKIDTFVEAGVAVTDVSVACSLINENFDARDYFYDQVGAEWIDWLHRNGFFAVLNEQAKDPTRYSFSMPELNYLERVVADKPQAVVAILLEIDCVENFNPEVVDRSIRISERLSGDLLAQMVEKMHRENWVHLMRGFNFQSYAYTDIIKRLKEEQNTASLILVADTILTLQEERDTSYSSPFILHTIGDQSIFEALTSVEKEADLVNVHTFLITKLAAIIGSKEGEDAENRMFPIEESFYLFNVDLFTHCLTEQYSSSYHEDIENLVAALVVVTRKLFEGRCDREEPLRNSYAHLSKSLSESRTGWRLRLFTASLCPELFKEELHAMFNRLFEVMSEEKSYYEIESGTEYKKALRASWSALSDEFKQAYIQRIFEYFDPSACDDEKLKEYHTRDALRILKMIEQDVDDTEVRKVFGRSLKDEKSTEPEPIITHGFAGAVVDRSPIVISDQDVAAIPALLRTELRPEAIETKYKDDPFHNPRNVEGVGTALRKDVEERLEAYLSHISEFFAPNEIHPHYLYSVLYGIETAMRDKKTFSEDLWKRLFALIEQIEQTELVDIEESKRSFLGNWSSVHRAGANVMKHALGKDVLSDDVFVKYRERILAVIASLLQSDDPQPEFETEKYGDLLSIAINHTRGVAYQAFMQFLYRDGEELEDDAREVLNNLIQTNRSFSTWSIIGQYVPSVYFRDPDWVTSMLPTIFTLDKPEQFFAVWEGYIVSSVYHEVFRIMEPYYAFALGVTADRYPRQERSRVDLDEAIGVHLGLAYTHFEEVTLDHLLILKLWQEADAQKQQKFIAHLGRRVISSNLIKPDQKQVKKLIELWDWLLAKQKGDIAPEVYGEFGLWIRGKGGADIVDTAELAQRFATLLELSEGRLDYEYHLQEKLPDLATANADATVQILRNLLLGEYSKLSQNAWIRSDVASVEVFSVLYASKPKETTDLINQLLEEKGRVFWKLKKVVQ